MHKTMRFFLLLCALFIGMSSVQWAFAESDHAASGGVDVVVV